MKSASILLRGYCRNGGLWRRRIDLARVCRRSNVTYARNTRYRLRFENRRQCDFYALRRGAQLGPEKLALADADGSGMLRDRVDGGGCIALRYRAIRCRGDALFAAKFGLVPNLLAE